ncbi:MAG TPA: hypothetical protein VGL97_21860 [Bryobacteraceae bacterium]
MKRLTLLLFRHGLCTFMLWGSFVHAVSAQGIPQSNQQDSTVPDQSRTTDWHTFLPNTSDDQKRIFRTFPEQLVHGKLGSGAYGRGGYNRPGYRGSI